MEYCCRSSFRYSAIAGHFFAAWITSNLIFSSRALGQPNQLNVVTNGEVTTIVTDETTKRVYFGGDFTKVGPRQPYGAIFDVNTGQVLPNFPEINGAIRTSYPDGNGGYFIGGDFTQIGSETRNYLARLNSTGQLTDWAKDLHLNGSVNSLVNAGGNVYVGGDFSGVNLNSSGVLFSQTTREAFNSFPSFDGAINTALADGQGGWYVGGSFTLAGGLPRNNLAHITSSGVVDDFFKDQTIDGGVNTLALSGNNLYVGGAFERINPIATSGAKIGSDDIVSSTFPKITGAVFCAVADGSGGWIIGGTFTRVGDQDRNNIARINSDGSVSNWYPQVDAAVYTLHVDQNVVYIGGSFGIVNGESRNSLAAVDLASGTLSDWAPDPGGVGVSKITSSASFVFIASDVNMGPQLFGGNSLKAIEKSSGLVDSWDFGLVGNKGAAVYDIEVANEVLYVAGGFSGIAGTSQQYVASFDISSKSKRTWNPMLGAAGGVFSIEISGSNVYLGGDFGVTGGYSQNFITCVDATTGVSTGWDPQVNDIASHISISGSSVYLAGSFSQVGGQVRNRFAKVDINSAAVSSLNVDPNFDVYTLSPSGTDIFVGGQFSSIGGTIRSRLLALDKTSGQTTSWNPNANGDVVAMEVNGSSILIGGDFTLIGAATRNYAAEVDLSTGLPTNWDPSPNSSIQTIAVGNGQVYLGGYFSQLGGTARSYLGSVDLSTGAVTGWNPSPNGIVNVITIDNNLTYIGGSFTFVGGMPTNYFAQIDGSGSATNSIVNVSGPVCSIAIQNSSAIVGGVNFYGGQGYVSDIDLSLWAVSDWNVQPNGGLTTLSSDGSNAFVGGNFSQILGAKRNLAVLDAVSGSLTNINPNPDGPISGFAVSASAVFVSGNFSNLGGQSLPGIASLTATTGALLPWSMNCTNCTANGPITIYDTKIFVTGKFDDLFGNRFYTICAFDLSSGSMLWDISQPAGYSLVEGQITAITTDGQKVFAGGPSIYFELDFATGMAATPQTSITVDNQINSLAVYNNKLYLLGNFSSVSGASNTSFATTVDLPNESLSSWNPSINNAANTISFSGNTFLVGGEFTGINPQTRNHVAALDGATGDLLNWNPDVNGSVEKLSISNNEILVGGTFTTVGGQTRNNVASVDAITGAVGSWNPNADNTVHEIRSSANYVYVGGNFNNIGGQSRNFVACIDPTSGLATSWNPSPNATVNAIDFYGDNIYLGGAFTTVNGQPAAKMASVSTGGSVNYWNPVPSDNASSSSIAISNGQAFVSNRYGVGVADATTGYVRKIMLVNSYQYVFSLAKFQGNIAVVGNFTQFASTSVNVLAVIDDQYFNVGSWPGQPIINGTVKTMAGLGSQAYIGGTFSSVNGKAANGIAVIPSPFQVVPSQFQSISFDPIPVKGVSDSPFTLNATASSGLAISFVSSDPTVATISGNIVTPQGIGSCTITAMVGGNTTYNPAQSSQPLNVVAAAPTHQPTSLSFSSVTTTSFSVSFAPSSDSPSGYLVLKKLNGPPTSTPEIGTAYSINQSIGDGVVASVGSNTSFSESSLASGSTYFYTVYPFNGSGAVTNYLIVSPLAGNQSTLCDIPTISDPSSISQHSVDLSWASIAGASGYSLDISSDNFQHFITGYENKSLGALATYSPSDLSGGTTYQFRIRATNAAGSSGYSNIVSALTIPETPVTNNPSSPDQTSFVANWGEVTGASSYSIDVATSNDFANLVANNVSAGNANSYAVSGLASGANYYYRVRAANSTGTSPNSNVSTALTIPPNTVAQPADHVLETSFTANWNLSTGASDYLVELSSDDFASVLQTFPNLGNVSSTNIANLTAGSKYQYRVTAINSSGAAKTSNVISVLTLPNPPIASSATGATQTTFVANWSKVQSATQYLLEVASSGDFVLILGNYNPLTLGDVNSVTVNGLTAGTTYYYRVRAVNGTGGSDYSNVITVQTNAAAITQAIPGILPGGNINSYSMFSIPLELSDSTIQSIFSSLGQVGKDRWRLLHWKNGDYVEYGEGNELTTIDRGNSYWINSITVPSIVLTGAPFSKSSFQLKLAQGWNQIGSPYNFDVSWTDVLAYNASLAGVSSIESNLYKYVSSTASFVATDNLKAWGGSFVFNGGQILALNIPSSVKHATGGRKGIVQIESDLSNSNWMLPLSLKLSNVSNDLSGIGMNPEASKSYDKFDAISLPRWVNYIDFTSYHSDFFAPYFSRDVVPTATWYNWHFTTESNFDDHSATLSWDNKALGNNEAQLMLFDPSANILIDMKSVDHYSFVIDGKRSLRFFYSVNKESLHPDVTSAFDPYPNPATSSVKIPFITSESTHIKIALFDLTGKQVREILSDNFSSGLNQAEWDCNDSNGERVPSGIYIYRFSSNSNVQVGKLVIK